MFGIGKSGRGCYPHFGAKSVGCDAQPVCHITRTAKIGLRVLRDTSDKRLDEALVVCFEKDKSFTGEDICELHTHGSTAVISAVLTELNQNSDLRSAEPGEFTRQALENGRLDLAQVEGLAD